MKWGTIILLLLLISNCRENIVYDNDIDYSLWICDTINVKYNPAKDEWKCTVRCTNQNGDEYTEVIDCDG